MKIKCLIEYKSVLEGIKNIEKRNDVFNSLDDETKRREIAFDGLSLVLSGKIRASFSSYWNDILKSRYLYSGITDLQKFFLYEKSYLNDHETKSYCKVCQRGLMMISQIRLGNSIKYSYDAMCGTRDNIKGFSLKSFLQMEAEFERCKYFHPYENNTTIKLANICCNVIVNGDFDINDNKIYVEYEQE